MSAVTMLSHHGAPPLTAVTLRTGPFRPPRWPVIALRPRTQTLKSDRSLRHMGYIVSPIDGDDHILDASDAQVSDGHLRVVTGLDRKTVAVYAPGQWLNAREDGKATFVAVGGSR